MALLIFYFCLAVFISFLCSVLEAVILSVPYSYIESSQSEAKHLTLLKKLKYQMSRSLSAILTLNTIANTLGAAGVGAQAYILYTNKINTITDMGGVTPYISSGAYVAFFSVLLTLTILIIGEIIPKTLGAAYWRALLPPAVYGIQGMIFICYPFVSLFRYVTKFFKTKPFVITREDILGAAKLGANEGAIYKNEGALIVNILKLKRKKVSDIMTPRTVITAFEKGTTIKEIIKKHQPLRFSRIPVYEENLDQVIGLVHRYKILEANLQGFSDTGVENYLKPVHSVPETISVTAALNQFIKRKEHIFIVVDEYGAVEGLVTMEDVVETILGIEIVDELDSVADMREEARQKWRQKKMKKQKRGKVNNNRNYPSPA